MGRLGFRVGVSASYSYFRRVRNFDFVYTAAVSVPLAKILMDEQNALSSKDCNVSDFRAGFIMAPDSPGHLSVVIRLLRFNYYYSP